MARTNKENLDYFSHDVGAAGKVEFRYLISKHGRDVYFIYFEVLCKIYGDKGYYIDWTERTEHLFCSDWKIDTSYCKLVIDELMTEGFFDRKMYESYGILTSKRVQENYIKGCERRKKIELVEDYILLAEPKEVLHPGSKTIIVMKRINANIKEINVNINSVKEEINGIDVNINSQKEKEKEKESLHIFNVGNNSNGRLARVEIANGVSRETDLLPVVGCGLPGKIVLPVEMSKIAASLREWELTREDFRSLIWEYYPRRDIDFEKAFKIARRYCKKIEDATLLKKAVRNYADANLQTEEKFLYRFDNFILEENGARVEFWGNRE